MSRIVFSPEARLYLEELAHNLYFNNYFGFEDSAEKYVRELHSKIVAKLPSTPHKAASPYFNRFGRGMRYATFPKNRHTSWYVFFNIYYTGSEIVYLVRYINNNHYIGRFLNNG